MLNVKQNISLSLLTTFRIGGPARYLAEVRDKKDLEEAFDFAHKNSLETVILGGGSNVLVSDKGFDGLVVLMKNNFLEIDGTVVSVGAGTALSELVRFAAESGLAGLEWAVGIPGTVGGAIRGNAGAYGGEIGNNVESVEIADLKKLQIVGYGLEECEFGYRSSIFKKDSSLIIISSKLRLKKGDSGEIREKVQKISQERIGKIVKGASAGSFFVNPVVTDEELRRKFVSDTGLEPKGEALPAGWLIERAGLLGKKVGGAMVSEQHGNFIINTGNATAEEVVMLASIIKQKVRNKYGVQLKEEVVMVGF